MEESGAEGIYGKLGCRPVINAVGHRTVLGGTTLSPQVLTAMREANRYFVDMAELLERSGSIIAELLNTEAARVTPGASAALALGTAACLAGTDAYKIAQLPDATWTKREVIVQHGHRYKYDRCTTIVGGLLREVGGSEGTSPADIEAAIEEQQTAAILFPAHLDARPGTVPLAEVVRIAKRRQVPVLVDAAFQVFPLEHMRGYLRLGADLVCFAAKYFEGPTSGGILCGRRELIESAAQQDFIGFETLNSRSLGRTMKLGREEIVAVVVALQEWMSMDHEARLLGYQQTLRTIAEALTDVPAVVLRTEALEGSRKSVLHIRLDSPCQRSAPEIAAVLREGNPSIWVGLDGDAMTVSPWTLAAGQEAIVAARLRSLLRGK